MSNYEPAFVLIDVVVRQRSGTRAALKRCTTTGVLYVATQVRKQEGWSDCLPPVPLGDLQKELDASRRFIDHIESRWLKSRIPEQTSTLSPLFWAIAMPITGIASVLITQLILA